jgi:hypothetical protein
MPWWQKGHLIIEKIIELREEGGVSEQLKMRHGMTKHENNTNSSYVVLESKIGKAPYTEPRLRVYGAVNRLTSGTYSMAGFDSSSMMMTSSDRALKENIVRVGTHSAGFGLYVFDYKPEFREAGIGRQFGVMADEVEAVLPEAVVMHPDGYKQVNYALLGIDLSDQRVH